MGLLVWDVATEFDNNIFVCLEQRYHIVDLAFVVSRVDHNVVIDKAKRRQNPENTLVLVHRLKATKDYRLGDRIAKVSFNDIILANLDAWLMNQAAVLADRPTVFLVALE